MFKISKMRKFISLGIMAFMVCSLLPSASVKAETTDGQVNLQILATSDDHGRFLPYDYEIDSPDTSGSLAQISTAVKQFKSQNPNTILVDAGDVIQDNSANLFINDDKNPMMVAMNYIGYDVLTFGNHEFNYGIPLLKKNVIDQFKGTALCGNVYTSDGNRLAAPYTVLDRGGVKVGIIGMTTPNIKKWDAVNLKDCKVTNPIDETNAAIAALKKQNVDLIIAVDHVGETCEDDEPGSGANQILDKCPGIDAFVAAHFHVKIAGDYFYNHTIYSLNTSSNTVTKTALDGSKSTATMDDYNKAKANGTVIVEAYKWDKAIAQINFKLTKNSDGKYVIANKATDIGSAAYDMSNKSGVVYEPDETLSNELQSYSKVAIDNANVPVGTLKGVNMVPKDKVAGIPEVQTRETPFSDFLNEVQLYYSKADVAAICIDNDKASLDVGSIKAKDIVGNYGYALGESTVYKITGKDLKAYMEWAAGYFNTLKPGDITISFNPQRRSSKYSTDDIFGGVKYKIDLTKPQGSRIVDLEHLDGTPIKDDETLKIAMNSYRMQQLVSKGGALEGETIPKLWSSTDPVNGYGDTDGTIVNLAARYIKEVKGGVLTTTNKDNWSIIGVDRDSDIYKQVASLVNSGKLTVPSLPEGTYTSDIASINVKDVPLGDIMPQGAVIIGNTAYNLGYANKNEDEISKAVSDSNGVVYVKDFSDSWIDNKTGNNAGDIKSLGLKVEKYVDSNGNSTSLQN